MFFSSRHIQEMRDSLLAISSTEWFFLVFGLILGAGLWLLINRRIVRRVITILKEKGARSNPVTFCESTMGFAILVLNGTLLYLATQLPSYFLFSFAVTGLFIGGWITMPADN
jgi:hypothetical protein